MSDLMLLRGLRMPMPANPDYTTMIQFISSARHAADRIEDGAKEIAKLRADLAAEREKRDLAQREVAAWQKAADDYNDPRVQHIAAAWWIKNRVAELLAQEGGK